jgi:hypothetical protein
MKHFLIKPINCIVSDAEFVYPEKGGFYFNGKAIAKAGTGNSYNLDSKNILFSNQPLEGIKPFELVDEVEELVEKEYPLLNVPDGSNVDWGYRLGNREGFFKGYKAKAGYNLEQMIGFAEWVTLNYRVHDRLDGILYYFPIVTEKFKHQMFSSKELLTLYLQEQESRMIEVQMIQENIFKIK